jgi:hypothetical protein
VVGHGRGVRHCAMAGGFHRLTPFMYPMAGPRPRAVRGRSTVAEDDQRRPSGARDHRA